MLISIFLHILCTLNLHVLLRDSNENPEAQILPKFIKVSCSYVIYYVLMQFFPYTSCI